MLLIVLAARDLVYADSMKRFRPEATFASTGTLPLSQSKSGPTAPYPQTRLDASFAALSDATRRGALEQLGRSDASITLAEKFHMTLTGMKKHVGVLEEAGLVTREGRARADLQARARAKWRKRRHGSTGTTSSGIHASASWTRLSGN